MMPVRDIADISYSDIAAPIIHRNIAPVDLTTETMELHRQSVLERMQKAGYDCLVIYADREHGSNYAYLTGFEPRFEESVLILHTNGRAFLLLGNENLKMATHSYIKADVIHVPQFSLPYQPNHPDRGMCSILLLAGIHDRMRIGCVGWKCFTSAANDSRSLMDVPYFIVAPFIELSPNGTVNNAADIFIGVSDDPDQDGLRHTYSANEIAHYEYGASLASSLVFDAMNALEPGKTEIEVASCLNTMGQPTTVTTICAAGKRFTNAVVFPRNRQMQMGDPVSITVGLRGGLTSRASYLAYAETDIPLEQRDYVERLAIPYYRAAVAWYENVGIGVSCDAIYHMIEEILPKELYNWKLNPGHYTGQDEWTASPFYTGSDVHLKSGAMLQMDIIPSIPGYAGAGMEDGVVIADHELQRELQERYPEMWLRMKERKEYLRNVLGIVLQEEVFPMSDLCGYFRPYLMEHGKALCVMK